MTFSFKNDCDSKIFCTYRSITIRNLLTAKVYRDRLIQQILLFEILKTLKKTFGFDVKLGTERKSEYNSI